MNKKEVYRHGDMILYSVSDLPTNMNKKEGSKLSVGLGEVTGHSHDIFAVEDTKIAGYYEGEAISENDIAEMDKLFFEITGKGGLIVHEEHDPIYLKPGKYLRIVQVQYNPFNEELEQVRD